MGIMKKMVSIKTEKKTKRAKLPSAHKAIPLLDLPNDALFVIFESLAMRELIAFSKYSAKDMDLV
jgi:hypothetical protein